jgi:plasmid replication initiation protein
MNEAEKACSILVRLDQKIGEQKFTELLYCYKEQKPQGKKIHFSLYRLCQVMRKVLSKRKYDRMRDSLNRLTSTTMVARRSSVACTRTAWAPTSSIAWSVTAASRWRSPKR